MRSAWVKGMLLAGVALLGTGASVEGIKEARQWQYQGDLARAHGQWEMAYLAYRQIADTFPNTRHGKLAAKRARVLEKRMRRIERSPAEEDAGYWVSEIFDFLLWP